MLSNLRNFTIRGHDTVVSLHPGSAWAWQDHGQQGQSALSNAENATVVLSLPQNTTTVFWQGFKCTGPALYSVCMDCSGTTAGKIVDGHTSDMEATNSVTTIFSMDVPQDGYHNHSLRITNLLDSRFTSPGQINLDSFIVTCSAPWPSSPTTTTTTNTTAIATSSKTMASDSSTPSSPSAGEYWSGAHHHRLSVGAVFGIVAGAISAFCLISMVARWMRRRRWPREMPNISAGRTLTRRSKKTAPGGEESIMMSSTRPEPKNDGGNLGPEPESGEAEDDNAQWATDRRPINSIRRSQSRRTKTVPSIYSFSSSFFSDDRSFRSKRTRSRWGAIPFNIGRSESDARSEFDTPLSSSELGVTFGGPDVPEVPAVPPHAR